MTKSSSQIIKTQRSWFPSLALATIWLLLSLNLQESVATKNASTVVNRDENLPQPRIIGGQAAERGRYPYMVSLHSTTGTFMCGGSLIAPDVVLTAAHCRRSTATMSFARVNSYNRVNPYEDFEEIEIISLLPHPNYRGFVDETAFDFDYMIAILASSSSFDYISLNANPDIPTGAFTDEVRALGFGYTSPDSGVSQVLQQVDLTYIPNNVCVQAKDPSTGLSYQGLIRDDMMCAADNGEDSCQGDSGGPLIVPSGVNGFTKDVQVGIVAWGYGCASAFPGVYSRVSTEIDWIRFIVCENSQRVPTDLVDCNNLDFVDLPSENTAPITILIKMDGFPTEVGWRIKEKLSGKVLVSVLPNSYTEARTQVQETVFLKKGDTFTFEITDTAGDGLCCDDPGHYVVYLGRGTSGTLLISGSGNFGSSQAQDFIVPSDFQDDTDSEDDGPVLEDGQTLLTIQIKLDSYPTETSWKVDRLGIEVEEVINIRPGTYSELGMLVTRTLVIREKELYYFRLLDMQEDGIMNGFVKLFLGTTDTTDSSRIIFESDGNFDGTVEHTFIASFDTAPTSAPMVGDTFLTLELRLDLYPEEIGVQLRMNGDTGSTAVSRADDSVVFFRPPRYYSEFADTTVTERINVPIIEEGESRGFTFIITDSYGDGLCCNYVGQTQTGYSLYEGEIDGGRLIVTSRLNSTSREVISFVLDGSDGSVPSIDDVPPPPSAPQPKAEIIVTIALDIFPDETGFYIEDSLGQRVVEFPPGTYRDPSQVVKETIKLEIGVYVFAIVDQFGDGMKGDEPYYNVRVKDDPNRPDLIAGTGLFGDEERQVFVVEGPRATYPIRIEVDIDDDPEEFGLSIKKLDLVYSNALVASAPEGTYQTPNTKITEKLNVVEGGLYRVLFEDSGNNGVDGDIDLIVGSSGDKGYQTFFLDGNDFREKMQVKIFAGALPSIPDDPQILTLRMMFDRFPHEFEWILLAEDNNGGEITISSRALPQTEVVAYGPVGLYSQSLASTELVEEIPLPAFEGERKFTMIITDEAGDGACCQFGDGGPVELYEGNVDPDNLLFSHPFNETGRLIKSFTLVGTGIPDTTSSSTSMTTTLPLYVTGSALILLSLFF